ncbi:hypothetical protein NBRC116602_14550 [Hyphomicrobiales bacterium 4NK60-0047b]
MVNIKAGFTATKEQISANKLICPQPIKKTAHKDDTIKQTNENRKTYLNIKQTPNKVEIDLNEYNK